MASIIVGVEADEVAVKNAQQDFTTDWEDTVVDYSKYGQLSLSLSIDRAGYDVPIDFRTREGGMEEEPDLDIGEVVLWYGKVSVGDVELEAADFELGVDVSGRFGGGGDDATEEHREEHKVIVLHPDHAVLPKLGADGLCKFEVDLTVGEPVRLVKVHFTWVVMEEGPQDGV